MNVQTKSTHLPRPRGVNSDFCLDPAVSLVTRYVEDGINKLTPRTNIHWQSAHSMSIHVVPEAKTWAWCCRLGRTDKACSITWMLGQGSLYVHVEPCNHKYSPYTGKLMLGPVLLTCNKDHQASEQVLKILLKFINQIYVILRDHILAVIKQTTNIRCHMIGIIRLLYVVTYLCYIKPLLKIWHYNN